MHGSDLANTVGPGPVGENMRHADVGGPARLVQVEAVLLETRQVNDSKVGAARLIVGNRLAQVIPPVQTNSPATYRYLSCRKKTLSGDPEAHQSEYKS